MVEASTDVVEASIDVVKTSMEEKQPSMGVIESSMEVETFHESGELPQVKPCFPYMST